jgi:hypothetical protein
MATATKNKATSLDDVLGAVNGVGQRVDALSNKVDSIDRRVSSLEKQPALKTRVVHQPSGNGRVQSPPEVIKPVTPVQDDEGEDEAIAAGTWEKSVKTSRCYRIDVTKVRSPQFAYAWKLLLRLRGQRRPAVIIGWNGTDELIEMMREAWPAVNEDIFDEALFEEKWAERRQADAMAPPPIVHSDDNVLFEVDWFRTAPNHRGHTFINVEGVYPVS